jgi:hypothetical protein
MSFWFGCRHKRTSFPITLPKNAQTAAQVPTTYIVCLDCGREIPYDWTEMRVLKRWHESADAQSDLQHAPSTAS